MTKKARKTGKRSLAVFLSILMLMTSWVFVAPTAEALQGGKYKVRILIHATNDWDGTWSNQSLTITYRKNDGSGSNDTYTCSVPNEVDSQKKIYSSGGANFGYYPNNAGVDLDGIPISVRITMNKTSNGLFWNTDGSIDAFLQISKSNGWSDYGGTATNNGSIDESKYCKGVASGSGSISGTGTFYTDIGAPTLPSYTLPTATWPSSITIAKNTTSKTASCSISPYNPSDQYGVWQGHKWSTDNTLASIAENGNSGGTITANASSNHLDYTFNAYCKFGYATRNEDVRSKQITVYVPHNITINPNGGSYNGSTSNTTIQMHTNENTTLSTPTRTGYHFTGWTTTGGTVNDNSFTAANHNSTLTANWEINQYTITFNDWNGVQLQTGKVNHGVVPTKPTNPTRNSDADKHYTFSAWDPTVVAATADATYVATYTGTNHNWNNGVVTKTPTCKETGTKVFTCQTSSCGRTRTDTLEIDPNNHANYGTEIRGYVAPTCETAGYTGDTYCKGCGAKLADGSEIPALGHDWGAWAPDTNGTTHTRVCRRVASHTETVAHNFGAWTEDGAGNHTHVCQTCNHSQTEKISYTVNYTASEANVTNLPDPFTKVYGTNATLSSVEPQRPGYTFSGWKISGDTYAKGGTMSTDYTVHHGDSVNLVAQWLRGNYTVTYTNTNTDGSPVNAEGDTAFTGAISVVANDQHHLNGNISVSVGGNVLAQSAYTYSVADDKMSATLQLAAAQVVGAIVIDAGTDAHSFEYVSISDTQHKQVCSDCGYEKAPVNHDFRTVGTTEGSCVTQGTVSYECHDCGKTKTEETGLVPTHHPQALTRIAPKTPNCTEEGNNEYYQCPDCHNYYKDANGTQATSVEAETLPTDLDNHNLQKYTNAKTANCMETGLIDSWKCSRCHKIFSDNQGTTEIQEADTVQEKDTHNHKITPLTMIDMIAADCDHDGRNRYYKCEACGKFFTDPAGQNDTTEAEQVVPALGHLWNTDPEYIWSNENHTITAHLYCGRNTEHVITEEVETVESIITPPTCTATGVARYTATFTNDPTKNAYNYTTPFTVQKTTSDVDKIPHELTKHDAVSPTCSATGNIDYWTCSVCGGYFTDKFGIESTTAQNVVLAIVPSAHNYGEWEDDGDSGHKRVCSYNTSHVETGEHTYAEIPDVNYLVSQADCTKPMTFYKSCSVCGHKGTETFTYDIGNVGHKLVKIVAVEPTCTKDGNYEYYLCAVCNKLFTDSTANTETTLADVTRPATGHSFTGDFKDNGDGTHSQLCVNGCGTYGDPVVHTFDKEVADAKYLNGEATDCTSKTSYFKSCVCGAKGTETFESGGTLGHVTKHVAAKDPTCVAEGNYAYWECARCGKLFKNEQLSETYASAAATVIPATGIHTWGEWETVVAADCTQAGVKQHECSVCHQTENESIPALEHDFSSTTYRCNNDGTHSVKCTRCDVYGPAVACTTTSTSTASDCLHHGVTTYTCSVCGGTWKDDAGVGDHNMTAHPAKEATCTEDGNLAYWTCSACGKTFLDAAGANEAQDESDYILPATNHANKEYHAAVNAKCEQQGNIAYYYCPTCEKYFRDADCTRELTEAETKTEALGHNFYGQMKDNGNGTHSFKCTRCDVYGNPTTHTFDQKIVVDAAKVSGATCTAAATYHYSCACGTIDTEGTAGTFDNGQPTGHAYNSVKADSWVWTKSGETYTVTATVVCANDADHEATRNAVVTFTTTAPNCDAAGTRHYTATITLDNGTTAPDTKDEEVAKVGHSLVETAAVEETCETAGNSKYYTCSVCHKYFSDANGEHEIAANSWVIPAKGHDWGTPEYSWEKRGNDYYVTATVTCTTDTRHVVTETVKAVGEQTKDPTCTEKGETTYTATFTKERFSTQTKTFDDIPTVAHTLTKTEAKAATCQATGNIEYWTCSVCNQKFSDENGDHAITEVETPIDPDNHVALVHTAKVDATCEDDGNIEYWTCNDCHKKLVYNDAGKLVEVTDVVIPAGPAHHRFTTHVSEKDATCTQQGNVEYWTCSVCGKHFNGNTESANELTNVSTAPLGHDVTRTAAVAPTCTTDGNKEYWYCARCHQYFLADSITAEPVAFSATVDPKKGHTAVSVDAVAVQCEADGNKAYSYCSVCDTILTLDGVDVSLNGWTKSGNANVYTITQTGHAYGDPTWTWNDDHTSATATRICANDASHTLTETDNDIDTVVVPKTHTTDGKTTYTAEVTFAFDSKTYTDVVEVVDTASGHHTTKVNAKEATCEAAGNLEYWICNDEGCGKLFKDENALVETTLEAVTLEALGHNYVNPTWTWTQNGNFYTGATLTFTCANDATHKQTPEVTFTADQTNPDCTNAGKIVYTATATFEGKTYTDTKEVTLEKTDHTLTPTAAKNATCLADGNIAYWTCSVCNKIFSDENARYEITADDTVIPALGHTYDYAHTDYDWSTDHGSCTATATCIRCDATDTETKASTNEVKIPATCEAQGIRIYTADFDNENFATQTYDELIPANGHGTAVMHEGKAATCEAAGFEAYWTCSVCGKLFKAETLTAANEIANPIVIPAKGHNWDYENVDYNWNETEPYTCTATVTCKNDGTHTKNVTGSVTITDSTEANCTTDGSRTYTATFPADTSVPADDKTATTPALGHDFSESVDRAHVVDTTHHNYKCVRCAAYGIMDGEEAKANESVACTFHGDWLVNENETCTEPGSEWRKCDFCSNKETQEREALSHKVFSVDAKDATCVAIGNKAYTYCERCGLLLTVDGTSVEARNIKFNAPEAITLYKTEDPLAHNLTATAAKAATCEEDGNIAYWTCSLCGKIFNIENPTAETTAITLADTVIAATKHDFTGAVRDNSDNTHSKKCTKCDAYGIMVNGTPVKDGKEACYGGTATCTADATCSVCGHAYQAKLGHNYVLQSWTWTGYTAATAHYVCANDAAHTKDVEATVNKTDATVTCTAAGQNTYVATATFTDGDKTYTDTDTKTEVVNATGHNWDFENAVYSWDANQNCTVTLKCLNDEAHIYTEIGKNTTATTPATCEDTGSVKYTATFTINSTLTSTHTETLAALGHKWGDPAWTWTGNDTDGYTATVKLVCDRVASHEATPDVTVTKDTVAPTCEKDGRTVYTATATLDGRTYKDTKITIQPAKGHDWQAPVFTWTEAANGGYSAATALIACNNDPEHNQTLNCALTTETDDATCTEGGAVTYTATVTFNGQTYTEKKTAEVTALGHKYEFVDFTWTGNDDDGYTAAVANFKCANDPTHTTTAAATVTTETVEAICEADGKTTYTAKATFEGAEYTDEKVVVIPMLHHNWGEATYTWVKDGDQYQVTALRVCANNADEHQQTETVTTTSEIIESSGCESEGTILYTATFEAPFATQTREESVAVAGHTLVHTDYLDSTCTKAGNIEYWRCSVCGKIFTDEAATVDSYLGTDLAATVIAAKDHDFVMEGRTMVVLDNEDGTHSFKCSRCDAYGAVIDGVQTIKENGGFVACVYGKWTVTRKPTCMDPGEQKATCKICGHVEFKEVGYADHVIVRISAKSAKCEADGNKEYFKCNVCGKLFADAAATTETTLEAVTLPKLGHNFTGAIHNDGNGTTHSYLCVNGCGTYGNPQAHEFDQQIASQTYLRNVATCTEPATYFLSCKCGQASTQTFTKGDALGHNNVHYTGQAATCTQAGHTPYDECTRCHRREGYQVLDALNHGAYLPGGTGASADGSLKWTVYKCSNNCGDYYVVLNVTSIDAQGTRVPNVNVTITGNNTNITGKTDGNGDLKLTDEAKNRLMPGVYTVALEYVRDGSNYNTRGTITVKDDTVTGSYGKLTPYGGNASGSMGGEPTGEFRCSMCNTYESTKNVPVYGWFISIIHFFVHMISRIGK